MRFIYEDLKQAGSIDGNDFAEKPIFSFQYEYILVTDTVAAYAPKDRALHLDIPATEEDMELLYVNRPLTDAQKEEVIAFYESYPREALSYPEYDAKTQDLQESGTEIILGKTYKKYIAVDKPLEELLAIQKQEITSTIQNHLDNKAREFRFDDIKSARAQAGYPLDGTETVYELTIINEAKSLAKWELKCWGKTLDIESEVLAGTRTMPTPEGIISELPLYV